MWCLFGAWNSINTKLYSYVLATSFLVIIFLSPLLSGMADYAGKKLTFLKVFCYAGAWVVRACSSSTLPIWNGHGIAVLGQPRLLGEPWVLQRLPARNRTA